MYLLPTERGTDATPCLEFRTRVELPDAAPTALGLVVLLLASTMLALKRIAAAPTPIRKELRSLDTAIRVSSTRVVMKLASSALLCYFGGAVFFAGNAARNVSTTTLTTGIVGISLGIVLALGGLALLVLATLDAVALSRPTTNIPPELQRFELQGPELQKQGATS